MCHMKDPLKLHLDTTIGEVTFKNIHIILSERVLS